MNNGGVNFNPRPPCGGRHYTRILPLDLTAISIHAPRAGGDILPTASVWPAYNFNPRPPCGGRHGSSKFYADNVISIHAPRAGGDLRRRLMSNMAKAFQSTPPVRGATR